MTFILNKNLTFTVKVFLTFIVKIHSIQIQEITTTTEEEEENCSRFLEILGLSTVIHKPAQNINVRTVTGRITTVNV